MELNISKLFDFYSEIAIDIKRKDPNMMRNGEDSRRDNLSSHRSKDGNNLPNFDISNFYEEFIQYKLKLDTLTKEIKGKKIKTNEVEDTFGDDDLVFNGEDDIVHNLRKLNKDNITNDVIVDIIKSFQESLKKLSLNVSMKINKDDIDKYIKYSLVDLEKNQSKTSDALIKLDNRIKNISSNSSELNSFDKQELVQHIIIIDKNDRKIN